MEFPTGIQNVRPAAPLPNSYRSYNVNQFKCCRAKFWKLVAQNKPKDLNFISKPYFIFLVSGLDRQNAIILKLCPLNNRITIPDKKVKSVINTPKIILKSTAESCKVID